MPNSTTDLGGVTRAGGAALAGIQSGSDERDGIVTEALIAVHDTGDCVAGSSATIDTVLDRDRRECRGNVMVESHETAWIIGGNMVSTRFIALWQIRKR